MAQYQTTTLASATSALAQRLTDPSNTYWSLIELQNAIIESLRIFQTLTGFYRERETLHTPGNYSQTFYDLRTDLQTPSGGTYPYAFSITDNQLLSEIQSHLLEPVANPWSGTAQFSISAIASALQRNRDQFLSDSGAYVTRTTLAGPSPPVGRVNLPPLTLDIRRAGWRDAASQRTYGLVRSDEYAYYYNPSWTQTPALPDSYSLALTPPVSIQLLPAPSNIGTLDLCLVSSGPALPCNPAAPVILGVMDDYAWGVKYGALADLLSEDGPAFDPDRATYCRQMYNLAMSIAKMPVSTLYVQADDGALPIGSIEEYDRYRTTWQNESTATSPTDVVTISPNLLALIPVSNLSQFITIDMARSMIVPKLSADFLQVSQEFIEPILDLSQHIASFKMGGSEFAQTTALRDNFLRMSALQNARLRANITYNLLLNQPATKPDLSTPRLVVRT